MCFTILVVLLITALSGLKATVDMQRYIQYCNAPSAQVLWLGSSHTHYSVIPQQLFDQNGIASSMLAMPGQLPDVSYTLLRDAFRRNKPDLVVMDLFSFAVPYTYASTMNAYASQAMYDNLPDQEKASAEVKRTTSVMLLPETDPLKYEMLFRTRNKVVLDYISALFNAHDTYLSLSRAEWKWESRGLQFFGYSYVDSIFAWEKMKAGPYTESGGGRLYSFTEEQLAQVEPNEQALYWYREILTLCRQNGVELIVTAFPFLTNAAEEKLFEELGRLAQDAGAVYLPMEQHWENTGLDKSKDFSDIGHENYVGACKTTAYIGDYLRREYPELPDARLEPTGKYARFRTHPDALQARIAASELRYINDPTAFLQEVAKLNSTYAVLINNVDSETLTQQQRDALFDLCNAQRADPVMVLQGSVHAPLLTNLDGNRIDIGLKDDKPCIQVEGKSVSVGSGLQIVVWDRCDNSVIQSVYFNGEDNGEVKRK